MKAITIFLTGLTAAVMLSACASRPVEPVVVHVFSNQPDHEMVASISRDLDEKGFGHRINYRETPGGLEVGETVMVHSDDAAGFNHGQQAAAIVERHLGRAPVIKSPGHGNHKFTRGNLGLYIYLPGSDITAADDRVAEIFAGSCGEHSVTLTLMDSGRFRLELAQWDADQMHHQSLGARQGAWSGRHDELRLETAEGDTWTGRRRPGYGEHPLLVLDGPAEARDCRLQRPL